MPLVAITVSLLIAAGAAGSPADSVLALQSGAVSARPVAVVDVGRDDLVRWRVTFPAVQVRTVEAANETWQQLSLPGGDIDGVPGSPGLPSWTVLVAVPDRTPVDVTATVVSSRTFAGIRPWPVQTDSSTVPFRYDAAAYAPREKAGAPLVSAGPPARLHGVTLVPLTIHPASWDATTGELTVAHEVMVTLPGVSLAGFAGVAPLPTSYAAMIADAVVAPAGVAERGVAGRGPGGYLVICPAQSDVIAALAPLLDWRRRQGYRVELADTDATGTTVTSIKAYVQHAYDTWDPALEFVVLVGDANGGVALPCGFDHDGYDGEGDFVYTQLDGDDALPDVHLGRISVRTASELAAVVEKIVGYETAPPRDDTSWFTRACLTGDPSSSGISTIHVNQWVKAQLEALGFAPVDTIWEGDFAGLMLEHLSAGASVFGYRGFFEMSGFSSAYADFADNGGKLPFAVFPTCGTGDFLDETNARSEALLRNTHGGAIGAVGSSATATHTRVNNCFYAGTWSGAIRGRDHRQGVAVDRGRLELFRQYAGFSGSIYGDDFRDVPATFSTWNTLIGDPATDLWLAAPVALAVSCPEVIPAGATGLQVVVARADTGEPVAGAIVAAVREPDVRAVSATDSTGLAFLPLVPGDTTGPLSLTVWGHDLLPHLGSVSVGEVPVAIDLASWTLDDGAPGGDGDARLTPPETGRVAVVLRNLGTATAPAVVARLMSEEGWLTVESDAVDVGDLAGGAVARSIAFSVTAAADAPADSIAHLRVEARSGDANWTLPIALPVHGPVLTVADVRWTGDASLEPGRLADVTVVLANSGDGAGAAATAVLRSRSPFVAVVDSDATFASVPAGEEVDDAGDPFRVVVAPDAFGGNLAGCTLHVVAADGRQHTLDVVLPLGTASTDQPTGPDAHGYCAFDDTDPSWLPGFPRGWIEIDPGYGGPGVDVGLTDFDAGQDDTRVVELPFVFRFYGRDYGSISICSNGWIAMGPTSLCTYQGWALPAVDAPAALVAAYWCDLRQDDEGRVYLWHDEDQHRFVVQWSGVQARSGASESVPVDFEVVLADPAWYPTVTGDGAILCQYADIGSDGSDPIGTVGIQGPDEGDAICYAYGSRQAPTSAPLADGRAILFAPHAAPHGAAVSVDPGTLTFTLPPDGEATTSLHLTSTGDAGSALHYTITVFDPDPPTIVADTVAARAVVQDRGSRIWLIDTGYDRNRPRDLHVWAMISDADLDTLQTVALDFPPEATVADVTDMVGGIDDAAMLAWDGRDGVGAAIGWSGAVSASAVAIEAVVGVTVSGDPGYVIVPTVMTGRRSGEAVTIAGYVALTLNPDGVTVVSPVGGELWTIGSEHAISFRTTGTIDALDIALDRGNGAWESLATNVPVSGGGWPWMVTGPLSGRCLIRASATVDAAIADVSDGPFAVGHDLTWLTCDASAGAVPAGGSVTIAVTARAGPRPPGIYRASLLIHGDGGEASSVPVSLTVTTPGTPSLSARPTLGPPRPNPFRHGTSLAFTLPVDGEAELAIFDLAGHRVATLVSGPRLAGAHAVTWDGVDCHGAPVASSVFVARLEAAGHLVTRKLVYVK